MVIMFSGIIFVIERELTAHIIYMSGSGLEVYPLQVLRIYVSSPVQ